MDLTNILQQLQQHQTSGGLTHQHVPALVQAVRTPPQTMATNASPIGGGAALPQGMPPAPAGTDPRIWAMFLADHQMANQHVMKKSGVKTHPYGMPVDPGNKIPTPGAIMAGSALGQKGMIHGQK